MPSERKTQPTRIRINKSAFAARFAQAASGFVIMKSSLVESQRLREFLQIGSDVVEQRHEAEIHVQLLVTMEQREDGIVGDKVDFDFLVASDHDDVFHHTGTRPPRKLGEFKTVPVKMDGMYIVAGVAHANAVALALPQMVRRGHRFARKDFAVDGPQVEAALGCILFGERDINDLVGFCGNAIWFGEPRIAPVKWFWRNPDGVCSVSG